MERGGSKESEMMRLGEDVEMNRRSRDALL